MASIKQIAVSLVLSITTVLFTLALTYAFIPTFAPDLAGTPAAWAYTLIILVPWTLVMGGLLFIISRQSGD